MRAKSVSFTLEVSGGNSHNYLVRKSLHGSFNDLLFVRIRGQKMGEFLL